MKKKVLKVGFDLDGVILYNPTRIARPIIAFIKSFFFNKKTLAFYYPKTKLEKFFWRLFHLSSLFPAYGVEDIKKLVKERKIKAYLITGRYSFLKDDLDDWVKRLKIKNYFFGIYYNKGDEQPHLFKEKVIRKLKLDIYIEDNWDVVKYLKSQNSKPKSKKIKIFWIYNLFDKKIEYKNKFPDLKKALEKI